MALLHSLQLCGIRSFNPESTETINFNSPVTLFLGQNGCGKTTIIESICFALSGELPGGSNGGQGFLNDPKMSQKRVTKGAIKIKFYDTVGENVDKIIIIIFNFIIIIITKYFVFLLTVIKTLCIITVSRYLMSIKQKIGICISELLAKS